MNQTVGVLLLCAATVAGVCGQTSNTTKAPPPPPATLTMTGLVMVDDGSPLPDSVSIQVVCNGSERTVAHTLQTGDFGFQWSAQQWSAAPAASPLPVTSAFSPRGIPQGQTVNCDLRAELSGYNSGTVSLANLQASDGCDIGVIWLHRIGVRGSNMVSVSTLKAPKDARRDFDKGNVLLAAGKLSEAAAGFSKAVAEYPGFAEAWMNLGRIQYRMASADASESLIRAVSLDPKMAGAWQVLGYIAADRKDWKNAAQCLDQAERLEPVRSVLSWYYSAVAYYELGQFDEAERHIRTEMKLDPQFQYRRSEYVLGLILIARHDAEGGAEMLRDYLASSPNPRDVDTARTILSRLQPSPASE